VGESDLHVIGGDRVTLRVHRVDDTWMSIS
jgi:hypothetical protein